MKYGASITGIDSLNKKIDLITNPQGGAKGIKVGIVKSATYPIENIYGRIPRTKSMQVAQVAFWNEFGTKKRDGSTHIPSRPFMRNSIKDMLESNEVKRTLLEMDPTNPILDNKMVNKLGSNLVAIMQMAMHDPEFPPNAPFTKEQKDKSPGASTTPLIDTGLLKQSIGFSTTDEDGEGA